MVRRIPTPALVAALVLHILPWVVRPGLIGGDEPHFALIAHSIALDGDVSMDDDYDAVENGSAAAGARWRGVRIERHTRAVGDRIAPTHPLGLPILAAPFLAVTDALAPGAPPDLVLLGLTSLVTFMGLVSGWSLLIDRHGPRRATLVVLSIYFATPLWYTSRTLFAEPWLWAVAAIAIALLTRGRDTAAGVALAVLFWIKESSALIIAPMLVATLKSGGRGQLLRVGIPVAAGLGLWLARNVILWGDPFVTFQHFAFGNLARGAWEVLVGAAHGVIPFAPVAIIAILGWVLPRGRMSIVNGAALGTVAGTFTLTAAWEMPGGGSCFGPRLMIPAIAALAIPLSALLADQRDRRWLDPALRVAILVGIAIEGAAVANPWSAFWSAPWFRLLADQPVGAGCGALLGILLLHGIAKLPDAVTQATS